MMLLVFILLVNILCNDLSSLSVAIPDNSYENPHQPQQAPIRTITTEKRETLSLRTTTTETATGATAESESLTSKVRTTQTRKQKNTANIRENYNSRNVENNNNNDRDDAPIIILRNDDTIIQADPDQVIRTTVDNSLPTIRGVLWQVQGNPSILDTTNDLDLLSIIIQQEYNLLSNCPTTQQFGSITFFPNFVQGFGTDMTLSNDNNNDQINFMNDNITWSILANIDFLCNACNNAKNDFLFDTNSKEDYINEFLQNNNGNEPTGCAPDKNQFLQAINTQLSSIVNGSISAILDVVELITQANCNENDNTAFTANLTLVFEPTDSIFDTLDLDNQLDLLAQSTLQTYNEINYLNLDTCDPFARVLQSAKAILYDPFGFEIMMPLPLNVEQNENDNDNNSSDDKQDSMNHIDDPYQFRSNVRQEQQQQLPHRHRHRRLSDAWFYSVIFYDGSCIGCPSNVCLSDDTDSSSSCTYIRRHLHDSTSSCSCPRNAQQEIPTKDEFQFHLKDTIEVLTASGQLTFINNLVDIQERGNDFSPPTLSFNDCCGNSFGGGIPVNVNGVDLKSEISNYFSSGGMSTFGNDINCWDVSGVTDMSFAFENNMEFEGPLNCWDVSSVTTLFEGMFQNSGFNGNIAEWDVSSGINFSNMFNGASVFYQDLCFWTDHTLSNLMFSSNMFAGTLCPQATVDPAPGMGPFCLDC